ncbi:MAG: mechanosensitive ion channel [Coriobacteriales bacterium]|nr:mechanosensitive ion channel [Coriobacteriales bacterium]
MGLIESLNQMVGEFPATILITSFTVCITLFLIHVITSVLHDHLGDVGMHELSLVMGIMRVAIWATVVFFLGENVFHVEMGGLITALGVTSLVVSLGLQDLIKSVVAGILIVAGNIVAVGDQVILDDHRGEVMDINWHQITLRDRDGVSHIISNSALLGGSFMRLTGRMACRHIFEADIAPGVNLQLVKADIETQAGMVLTKNGWIADGHSPQCLFLGSSALGTQASIRVFIADIEYATRAMDAVMCAISERGYLADVAHEVDPRWKRSE